MSKQYYPAGWDANRVRDVVTHYESQSEIEQHAEVEAARKADCKRVRTRMRLFWVALALYLLGLIWGYARLPWVAVKSLADYRLIAAAPAVSFDKGLDVSPLQRRYLQWALPESATPVVPRLSAKVKWNAIVVARVASSHVVGNTGAEWQDGLYICVFGAWIHVYTFSHKMA